MVKSRHWFHWVMLIVMILSLSSTAAAQGPTDETDVYYIQDIFDVETRSAIAATGALILEVGHDYVLVEATAQEKKAIERVVGKTIAKPTFAQAVPLAFPPADSNYHDYAAGNEHADRGTECVVGLRRGRRQRQRTDERDRRSECGDDRRLDREASSHYSSDMPASPVKAHTPPVTGHCLYR